MDVQISNYLALNILDMVLVLISSLIIILIGKKFFWSTLQNYLQKRHDFMADELKQASEAKRASEEVLKEYQAQLLDAKQQVGEMISAADSQINLQKELAIKQTKAEITQLKHSATQQIEYEKSQLHDEMKKEISGVAFKAAKKILVKEIDERDHQQFIDEFIEQSKDDSWLA